MSTIRRSDACCAGPVHSPGSAARRWMSRAPPRRWGNITSWSIVNCWVTQPSGSRSCAPPARFNRGREEIAVRRYALEGVHVLDFAWVGVGPITTKYLADNGADVIRIESAAWIDVLRVSPPWQDGQPSSLNSS